MKIVKIQLQEDTLIEGVEYFAGTEVYLPVADTRSDLKENSFAGLLRNLQKKYPKANFRPSEEFDGRPGGIWASGETSYMSDGMPMFDYYSQDYDTYEFGVHKELVEYLEDQKSLLASTPSIWPVRGWLTSTFGYRTSPFTGRREMHKGLDIATRSGTPIIAPADGLVVFSGREGGFGNMIVIDHGYGITTRYGHCSALDAKLGQKIKRGDVIARVGNTGRSTGPHVHYEVAVNGVPVNPSRYILN